MKFVLWGPKWGGKRKKLFFKSIYQMGPSILEVEAKENIKLVLSFSEKVKKKKYMIYQQEKRFHCVLFINIPFIFHDFYLFKQKSCLQLICYVPKMLPVKMLATKKFL